jgi:protein regulator of cytokinesis 1
LRSPPEGSLLVYLDMDTSYLEKQVSTIINKLHDLFDEIGVPSHERDSRESELFAALSDTLHNQLRIVTK